MLSLFFMGAHTQAYRSINFPTPMVDRLALLRRRLILLLSSLGLNEERVHALLSEQGEKEPLAVPERSSQLPEREWRRRRAAPGRLSRRRTCSGGRVITCSFAR